MNAAARKIQRIYLTLTLGNTLAASFIWGINTLFLLDAGLSNLEAFAANAFFTAGMVLFEVPTGVIADGWGRRVSFLLGTATLAVSTYLYYLLWQLSAPFWCVGGGVRSARAGLHFLLRSRGGLARRRVAVLGVRGRAGDGARAGADGLGRCDARRLGGRRRDRAGHRPRRAVPAAGGRAAGHVRRGLLAHARRRVHPRALGASASVRPVPYFPPRSRTD